MTNEIDTVRADIKQYFDPNGRLGWEDGFSQSEGGLFYIETEHYKQTDPKRNWIITKVYVGHLEKNGWLFSYLTDNDDTCWAWIDKGKKEYLLLPETQDGQSILDISTLKLYSFYSSEDPFIWAQIVPSPDQTKLAVIGCYWACPYELLIYDCSHLLELPYPYMHIQGLNDTFFKIKEWADNQTVVLTNNKKYEKFIIISLCK